MGATNDDLGRYGITGATETIHNPSYELLYRKETMGDLEGCECGAVAVDTGIFTGRSPNDKYIVRD